jgi:hypothetical protein
MERMEKQTAVEWLVDYLKNIKALPFIIPNLNINEQNILNDIIEQAKEMEKAEKIKAQIDILKLAHLRLSVEGIDKFDNTMVFTVNELEQQLKSITFKSE